ncbi:hypothetical protein L209DRAFT_752850 [Thermothelomyces heterothallicus CBS 203.75]
MPLRPATLCGTWVPMISEHVPHMNSPLQFGNAGAKTSLSEEDDDFGTIEHATYVEQLARG